MWKLQKSDFFDSRFKRFEKKHDREAEAVLNNLDTYFKTLCDGVNPLNIKMGFIHHESDGIKAVDQKGGKGNLLQTRLYVFPEEITKLLHIISIGTKVDQSGDIGECREYVRNLKKKTGG